MSRLKEYGIKTRTIQEGKALTPAKYPRYDFNGSLEEKAYILGFRLGDLHVSKTHPNSPTIRVSSNSTKGEQIILIRELFSKFGYVKEIGPDKRGATHIRCYLNNSFNFLIPKGVKIYPWVLRSRKNSLAFFAGYVDAEACFSINHRGAPVFAINSQDYEIMEAIQSLILPRIKVRTKLHFMRPANSIVSNVKSNRDIYGIYVYNKSDLTKIISELLPLLKHEKRKNDALRIIKLFNHGRS